MQNLLTGIGRKYFASWSFAARSDIANISRLIKPFTDIYTESASKKLNIILMKYRRNRLESYYDTYNIFTFGDRKKYYAEVLSIENNSGTYDHYGKMLISNIGRGAMSSYTNYPIRGIRCNISRPINTMSIDIITGESIIDVQLYEDVKIYIRPLGEAGDLSTVRLYGNDSDGNILVETLPLFNNGICSESKYSYKSIYKVDTDDDINISNIVDCVKSNSIWSSVVPFKKIAKGNGEVIIPSMHVQDKSISIYDNSSLLKNPEIYFNIDEPLKKSFMTINMDILCLDDLGWLYTCKPERQMYDMPEVNGSLNDSRYIYVDNERSSIGEVINCVIYPHAVLEKYKSNSLKISVQNEDAILFLNKSGQLTTDSNQWVDVDSLNDIVNISLSCENKSPYVFCIMTQSEDKMYASSYQDHDNKNIIANKVDDLFIYNTEAYIVREGVTYLITPCRGVYMEYSDTNIGFDINYINLKEE